MPTRTPRTPRPAASRSPGRGGRARAGTEGERPPARDVLLQQREHLRALGELAAGVAHDLKSSLNAIRLRLELIGNDPEVRARQGEQLAAVGRIVADALGRLGQLQDFARQSPPPGLEQVDVEQVVREAHALVAAELDRRGRELGVRWRVELALPEVLPRVRGVAADLRLALLNLLLNARDAMPGGGRMRVEGRVERGKVVLRVEDEGTGLRAEDLSRLFRPFFTTKGPHGTGLGLAMAYGAVARAGGTLVAANRPGKRGAVFTLRLPAANLPRPRRPRAPRA